MAMQETPASADQPGLDSTALPAVPPADSGCQLNLVHGEICYYPGLPTQALEPAGDRLSSGIRLELRHPARKDGVPFQRSQGYRVRQRSGMHHAQRHGMEPPKCFGRHQKGDLYLRRIESVLWITVSPAWCKVPPWGRKTDRQLPMKNAVGVELITKQPGRSSR